ncbi:uncharacterized protein LOC131074623 [Cryptomeria japonica]|uniref:uncharacterized protein LOC131074623 n=1 Tax=Cryptomeria japonica TaxID=3369 RepID=UPI0027DA9C00|nr:uncharacterized protein LOC131074623 [Cryptomeria japonica]XP_059070012.1 uncharacterized protein LOC131074623 [Cryptomeria japonica]
MSLFVGNISSHVHHSELERVFRRFGRSKLELKDGYGFVVYDAVRDAEKALRALKGRIICGEHLSITWSRKQRPLRRVSGKEFQRSGYVNKFYRKEKDIKGKSFEEWEENTKDIQKHAGEEEAINNESFLCKDGRDDGVENDIFGGKRKHQNLKEALLDDRCAVEPIPLENDRWGEPLSGASNEYDMVEEATNLQNYDPYSDNRNEGDVRGSEKCQKLKSTDSYAANSSPERVSKHCSKDEIQMEYRGFGRSSERCFKCRRAGHVMCDCRSKTALSRRAKFKSVNPKQKTERNFRGNDFMRFKGPRQTNWSRRDFSRDNMLQRKDFGSDRIMGHGSRRFHHKTERFSGNRQKHSRHLSDYRKEDQTIKKTGKGDNKLRTDSISQPTGVRDKSQSSFLHSESRHETRSNSSISCSQSSFSKSYSSKSDSHLASSPHSHSPLSHSDSRSLRSHSVSSKARSQSISDRSMSRKPIVKSRSPSATMQSLSVSLSPCIRKSSIPTQVGHVLSGSFDASNAMQSLKNALPFDSHSALSEKTREKSTANANLEGDHLRLAVKIDNDLRVRIVQDEEKEQQGTNTKDTWILNPSESGGKRETAFIYREKSHSDETTDKHNISEGGIMKNEKSKSSVLEIVELPADTTTEPVVDNSRTVHEKGINDPMLSKVNVKDVAHISLQEAKLIINYSKKLPIEETEHGSSVESYFGAARLWPLELIHYRRLKRGAISTENYARRMAQNEMFGIVDKYVRSSSGWWESESHEI